MREYFLPTTQEDMERRGWERPDFILISGDAYVDHPSFGAALIGRYLEAHGFKVGIIPQPNWREISQFRGLGRPRLAFLVTGGNIDSMVNHYTVALNRRKRDEYSPGGETGWRPDRAPIVYAQKAKEAYKKVPVILGGLEVSLRRLSHYDYWEDRVRRSILLDSRGDLLIYGMGEKPLLEVAEAMEAGIPLHYLTYIRGTVFRCGDSSKMPSGEVLPSYDEVASSRGKFAESFVQQYRNTDPVNGEVLIEPYRHTWVVQNPPAEPFTPEELDRIYRLPFTKEYHPDYEGKGGIPALKEVKFSLVSVRGCFGGCSFCSLHFHQGRVVQPRSVEGVVEEAQEMIQHQDFKGYIHDVGGPTANIRKRSCKRQLKEGMCHDRRCLVPEPCPNLEVDHQEYFQLLRQLRKLPRVKKVFVRSGIRFDYLLYDQHYYQYVEELCQHHVSGQLKVAPEHISPRVLEKMGKPPLAVYQQFAAKYKEINQKLGKKQYLVPYLISSHPGSDLQAAIQLAEYLREIGHAPQQVQDFYPTPGTLSTCMYYTEMDPWTGEEVYVPKSRREKAMQRALIQYRNPRNYRLVHEALLRAGREDLMGNHPACLIGPPPSSSSPSKGQGKKSKQ